MVEMSIVRCLLVLLISISGPAGCARSPFPPAVAVENDRTIAMPRFYDRPAITVGEGGNYYELDGEMLRAVLIATNDFLPPRVHNLPCGSRLDAQRYLVNRRDNVIFVYIYEDEGYCGGGYVALDSGVKYAISADGRILRRVFDGQPEEPLEWLTPDGGVRGVPAKPGVVPGYEPIEHKPSPSSPKESQDGGVGLSPEARDGGLPLEARDGGAGSPGLEPLPVPALAPDGGSPP